MYPSTVATSVATPSVPTVSTGSVTMIGVAPPFMLNDTAPVNAMLAAPVAGSTVPVPPDQTTFWLTGAAGAALRLHLSANVGVTPLRTIDTWSAVA